MHWGGCKAGLVPCGHPWWGQLDSGKQGRYPALMYTNYEAPLALWGIWLWLVYHLNKDITLMPSNPGDLQQKILPKSSLTDRFKQHLLRRTWTHGFRFSSISLLNVNVPFVGLVSPCESVYDILKRWPGPFNAGITKCTSGSASSGSGLHWTRVNQDQQTHWLVIVPQHRKIGGNYIRKISP